MKTWTLVWFLVLPPTDDGRVPLEAGAHKNLTEAECTTQLSETDLQYLLMEKEGLLQAHTMYCEDSRGVPIPIEKRT